MIHFAKGFQICIFESHCGSPDIDIYDKHPAFVDLNKV